MIFDSLIGSATSHELWKNIEERFVRVTCNHSIQLRLKLVSVKQGDKFIPSLINEIKLLANHLVVVGSRVTDDELAVITLSALNSEHASFATSIRI